MKKELLDYLDWTKAEMERAEERARKARELYAQAERICKKYIGDEDENE